MNIISKTNGPSEKEALNLLIQKIDDKTIQSNVRFGISLYNKSIYSKLDYLFDDKDRVTFDLSEYGKIDPSSCESYGTIDFILDSNGYELLDYINGYCKKKDENRHQKIVKILKRLDTNPRIIDGFINSPVRASKSNDYVVTLSRNIYDILSISTNKGWSSCMNIKSNSVYVYTNIVCGVLVIYIHKKDDTDLNNPTARILLKPLLIDNTDELYYQSEVKSYGTSNFNIKEISNNISRVINSNLPDDLITLAHLPNLIYNDGIPSSINILTGGLDLTNPNIVNNISSDYVSNNYYSLKEAINNLENKNILSINKYLYEFIDIPFSIEMMDYIRNYNKNYEEDCFLDNFIKSKEDVISIIEYKINLHNDTQHQVFHIHLLYDKIFELGLDGDSDILSLIMKSKFYLKMNFIINSSKYQIFDKKTIEEIISSSDPYNLRNYNALSNILPNLLYHKNSDLYRWFDTNIGSNMLSDKKYLTTFLQYNDISTILINSYNSNVQNDYYKSLYHNYFLYLLDKENVSEDNNIAMRKILNIKKKESFLKRLFKNK